MATKATQEGDKVSKTLCAIYGENVMSAQMLEVSPLGGGTELRVERDTPPMVK